MTDDTRYTLAHAAVNSALMLLMDHQDAGDDVRLADIIDHLGVAREVLARRAGLPVAGDEDREGDDA